ncbi:MULTISPECIES: LysM peptidoglycan-binding and 3D domain-containing protein [unclassified Viridibacillus]|uniref:LysM peptidoglycan-binding and 3D domain-containing protein n=1 Tax=unclassified Viridibacillus TaxID=2617942 RepID=UPI00096C2E79|nr:3D domain-containing protein [Viridibacillus sp. FSL H7-0596]OMC87780.1 peptidoglycan-binding protein [Viridibacillus sp. FSL H7-0596]
MRKQLIALAAGFLLLGSATMTAQAASVSYTVEKGDTLWAIAQANNISVEDLQASNLLDSSLIFPAQQLELESKSDKKSDDTYTIKKGDTLTKIAEENEVTIADLMSWNNLSSDLIFAGDTLALSAKATSNITKVQQTPAQTQEAPQAKQTKQAQSTSTQSATATPPQGGKTMTVRATAYTAYCTGCSGVTATGYDLRANPGAKVIAVDPSVIPLGSRVWVEGYGEAIASDTGGAIKGNRIDVFIPDNNKVYQWGVRNVTIKVLN